MELPGTDITARSGAPAIGLSQCPRISSKEPEATMKGVVVVR